VTPAVAFLDANVLFSAALGGAVFDTIRDLARAGSVRLVTSEMCVREALESLDRKRPDALADFDGLLLDVEVYALRRPGSIGEAAELVGPADAHVVAAAIALGADVLVTGDRRHFGDAMERNDLPVRIRTPRGFLLEGPG
jgi:predicted nucleic acid-binding protein